MIVEIGEILVKNRDPFHYNDVIMGAIASQITSLTIVFSTVYLDTDQRKHQSSASLAFVRGIHRRPVNSPHKRPVTRKMFPFDDVIVYSTYSMPCLFIDASVIIALMTVTQPYRIWFHVSGIHVSGIHTLGVYVSYIHHISCIIYTLKLNITVYMFDKTYCTSTRTFSLLLLICLFSYLLYHSNILHLYDNILLVGLYSCCYPSYFSTLSAAISCSRHNVASVPCHHGKGPILPTNPDLLEISFRFQRIIIK